MKRPALFFLSEVINYEGKEAGRVRVLIVHNCPGAPKAVEGEGFYNPPAVDKYEVLQPALVNAFTKAVAKLSVSVERGMEFVHMFNGEVHQVLAPQDLWLQAVRLVAKQPDQIPGAILAGPRVLSLVGTSS